MESGLPLAPIRAAAVRFTDAARGLKLTSETGGADTTRVRGADQFALEIDHFSECILSGRQPALKTSETLVNMRVLDALRFSATTGMRVELPGSVD